MAKRQELLKTVATSMTRAGVLLPRNIPPRSSTLDEMGRTAEAMKIVLRPIRIDRPEELQSAFVELAEQKVGGFVMSDASEIIANAEAIAALEFI
jgi:putative ABC transport system substrate-binding protein